MDFEGIPKGSVKFPNLLRNSIGSIGIEIHRDSKIPTIPAGDLKDHPCSGFK